MNKYFLELKEDSTPNKRVKVRDTGATEEPLLSEMSHKFRIKKVIVRKLEASNFTIINIVPVSVPNSANDSISFDTALVPECASRCCECAPSLEYLGQQNK